MTRIAPPALVRARCVLLGVFFATALAYFVWRLGVLNPRAAFFSWFVLFCEVLAFARLALGLISLVRLPGRAWSPAPRDLTVDVFITTVNEPEAIVRATLAAACAIRYPHATWLLDDGDRSGMRALAAASGCRYLSRAQSTGAKAGSLNHALAQATGAFVAVFDADHQADPAFLDRTLGYFTDARIAAVQTPHAFRNTDSFDHFVRGRTRSIQAAFQHIVQGARDATNTTLFCGSAAVLRRAALDAIGGFATGTINEDVHTSLRLHAAGMHTAFHAEMLSTALGAPDAAAADGQRLRWAEDAMQLVGRARLFKLRGLSNAQRCSYLFHVLSNLEGMRFAVIYALPVFMLATGIVPIDASAGAFVAHFAPYAGAAAVAMFEFSRGYTRPFETSVYNLARTPLAFVAPFATFAPRRFVVTPKTRIAHARSPFAWFPWLVIAVNVAAIVAAYVASLQGRSILSPGALTLLTAWAIYHLATAARLIALQRRCELPDGKRPTIVDATLAEFRAADRGDCGGVLQLAVAWDSVDADIPYRVEVAL